MAAPSQDDDQADDAQALPENPLNPCRYPTNCVRRSRAYEVDADALFETAERAVRQTGGLTIGKMESIRPDPAAHHFESTFRLFGFKDDLAVTVAPHAGGAVLHVRSASRTGRGDLGVNRRRVLAFFSAIEDDLGA